MGETKGDWLTALTLPVVSTVAGVPLEEVLPESIRLVTGERLPDGGIRFAEKGSKCYYQFQQEQYGFPQMPCLLRQRS